MYNLYVQKYKKIMKLLLYKLKMALTCLDDRTLTEDENEYKNINPSKYGYQFAIEII
tara:strand:+ start:4066 stop:4236 length:171 start_codon:yes stop_codon:yes gene_type:complete